MRPFGKQPEGFWRPVRAHMGTARKRLVLRAAPLITSWLWLACPPIHLSMNYSFQQVLPHSSHTCLCSPLIQMFLHTTLCVSRMVSSVSVPLGKALHDLWLGKHLTKCISFPISGYILLFQYLGASE